MKKIIIYILFFCIGINICDKIVVLSLWQYNRDYIVEFLCENTDIPEKNCDGKCFLINEFDKQNDNEKQAQNEFAKKFELTSFVFFVANFVIISEKKISDIFPKRNFSYFFYLPNNPRFGIFHPPQES